ncbi:MAG: hypothetical protein IJ730_01920, partial [Alphaproteobacteria bacterium]|nr:hypothetical protein [Alphaproteobacteria bacterium]
SLNKYTISSSDGTYGYRYDYTYNYKEQSGGYPSDPYLSYSPLYAAIRSGTLSRTTYDILDFTSGSTSGKNGSLGTTFSGSLNYTTSEGWGLYTISGNQTARITTKFRGDITLSLCSNFLKSYGTIKMNFGTNTSEKTVKTETSIQIKGADLRYDRTYDYYYMELTATDVVFLNAIQTSAEPVYTYPPSFDSSVSKIDWRAETVSIPTEIGYSGSISNYNYIKGYHMLNSSSCSPYLYPKNYPADITWIFDATEKMLKNFYMPDYSYVSNDTYISGITRLYSPMTRTSARKYAFLNPSQNNIVYLWGTTFSKQKNWILTENGYQEDGDTPTAAVVKLTSAACTKLINKYGLDLRIYVIKYKEQTEYADFPLYNKAQTYNSSQYATIQNCATSSGGKAYSVSTERDLKSTLDSIAEELKAWADYEPAKSILQND